MNQTARLLGLVKAGGGIRTHGPLFTKQPLCH